MAGDVAPDLRQDFSEMSKAPRLARLAHPLPIGMISVLQTPGSVAPGSLNVRPGIGGVQHVHVGGWHCERREPLRLHAAQWCTVAGDVVKSPTMSQPADGQLITRHIGQTKPSQEHHRRKRTALPIMRAAPAPGMFYSDTPTNASPDQCFSTVIGPVGFC
jgi:hypothetical protein